jgi:ATP-dependent Clp protease ATP-binding subunit ClpX
MRPPLGAPAAHPPTPLRARAPQASIGFGNSVREARAGRAGGKRVSYDILQHVEHPDLVNYGLIPEFVGRLPVIVALQVRALRPRRRRRRRPCRTRAGRRRGACALGRLLARVPVFMPACLCAPQELTEEELVRVLTEPRHALLKQYGELFRQSKAEFK